MTNEKNRFIQTVYKHTIYPVLLGCGDVTVSEYLQCSCPASKKLTAAGAGTQGDRGQILG